MIGVHSTVRANLNAAGTIPHRHQFIIEGRFKFIHDCRHQLEKMPRQLRSPNCRMIKVSGYVPIEDVSHYKNIVNCFDERKSVFRNIAELFKMSAIDYQKIRMWKYDSKATVWELKN